VTPPDRGCVLDASVALATALDEPLGESARTLVSALARGAGRIVAPPLFDAECAAGVVKAVRRGRLRSGLWEETWLGVFDLPVERVTSPVATLEGMRIALAHGISAYDAVYVGLSDEMRLPLITADARLVRALAGSPHDVLLLDDLAL
jgi:predicted nucleic acid-binding protein